MTDADDRPTPGQRLLALRVVQSRLSLLSALISCTTGDLDAMAVGRCTDRINHDLHQLIYGPTEQVQDVLDEELRAWGEYAVTQLYAPGYLDYGRRMLDKFADAWEQGTRLVPDGSSSSVVVAGRQLAAELDVEDQVPDHRG